MMNSILKSRTACNVIEFAIVIAVGLGCILFAVMNYIPLYYVLVIGYALGVFHANLAHWLDYKRSELNK